MTSMQRCARFRTWRRRAGSLMTLAFCAACAACSPAPRPVALMPPESLLARCPTPPTPPELMAANDLRAYALAATRHMVSLNAALDGCNADKAALRAWYARMAARMTEAAND